MAHRGIVAALAVLVLFSSVPLFRLVSVNFIAAGRSVGFDVSVRAPEGTSLEATEVMANRIATAIRRIPEVDYTLVTVAGDGAGTQNSASIYVKLKPIEARTRDQFAIMDAGAQRHPARRFASAGRAHAASAAAVARRRWRRHAVRAAGSGAESCSAV